MDRLLKRKTMLTHKDLTGKYDYRDRRMRKKEIISKYILQNIIFTIKMSPSY